MHRSPRPDTARSRTARHAGPRGLVAGLFLVGLAAAASPTAVTTQPAASHVAAEPEPHHDIHSGDEAHFHEEDAPAPVSPPVALEAGLNWIDDDSAWAGRWGPEIEPLATYDPQQQCIPGARPAVAAFAALLAEAHPSSRNLGITRGCAAGARSEHKEGRAYDWGVRVTDAEEEAAAQQMLAWLLATDEHGNDFAMARRLGVMYVIWDDHIWSSSSAREGWRVYTGPNPHTDHVHLSFDWAGAMGATSFWDGSGLDVGSWLIDGFSLGDFPIGFDIGHDRYRPELGATPGEESVWSAQRNGHDRRDDAAPPARPDRSDDDPEASSAQDGPAAPVASGDDPADVPTVPVVTVPPPLVGPALPWPPLAEPPTTTTTTTLVPLIDPLTGELPDALSEELGALTG